MAVNNVARMLQRFKEGKFSTSSSNQCSRPKHFSASSSKDFREDDIGGPLAVAHILKQMRKIATRKEVGFWDVQIEQCMRAARISAKIRQGWQQFGLPTVYDVVAHQPPKQLPRYHSLPDLRNG